MFCRVTTPVRIFGAALALVSATLLVAVPADDASAKGFKFRSSSKSSSKSDADASGPAANKHGEGEAGSASEGSGWSFRPRSRRSSEDESAERSDETPADAQTASEPAAPATPVAAAKTKPAEPEKQHPLAAPHKGMDVTVCEAGCANEKQQVVYMQPTTDRRATQSEMQPASSTPAASATDAQMIRCIGGCYDTPRVYASTLAMAKSQEDTQWLSTVRVTGAKKGKGAGAWMREIDQSRGGEAAPAAPVPADTSN